VVLPAGFTSFVFILDGELIDNDGRTFGRDDSFVTEPEPTAKASLRADRSSRILQVTLSAELSHFFFATSVPTDFEP
jgi:hypothetical protein